MSLLTSTALFLASFSGWAAARGGRWGQQPAWEPPGDGVPAGRFLAEGGCVPRNPIGALDSRGKPCESYEVYEGYSSSSYSSSSYSYGGYGTDSCGQFDDEDFSSALCEQCTPGLVLCPRGTLAQELARVPSSVEVLKWHGQELGGSLPPDFAERFPNLTNLSLPAIGLEGEIPEGLWSLPRLQHVELSYNRLVGGLSEAAGRARSLVTVRLSGNKLEGPLPAGLGNWAEIDELWLNHNRFSGGLPAAMANCLKVRDINLRHNMLSGGLPEELFGAWPNLRSLDLRSNRFSGPIPWTVGRWTELYEVDLSENELTGGLPATMAKWSKVHYVLLKSNMLSGELPEDVLGAWSNLEYVDLGNNRFSGPIPRAVGQWINVGRVDLAQNELSGPIPSEVGQWKWVNQVTLSVNKLTGPLPAAVGQWSYLSYLGLTRNHISGQIPEEVAGWVEVGTVLMNGNELTGSLPKAIGAWTQLRTIRLADNGLSGQLPADIGAWRNVGEVDLTNNHFTGGIPREIGKWSRTTRLALSGNNFSGELPQEFVGMTSLQTVSLRGNRIEGELPDFSGLMNLTELDIYSNRITGMGPLPPGLRILNICVNKLASLPEAIYELQELEVLCVAGNNIGSWPPRGVIKNKVVDGAWLCGLKPEEGRFSLPKLKRLDASENPMAGTTARSFLNSLAYLPSLTDLSCRNCQLGGVLHSEIADGLADDQENTGDGMCGGMEYSKGFVGLQRLDLSGNNVTELLALPSPSLLTADFSRNALERLDSRWFQTQIISLKIAGNPALRSPVMQPAGRCDSFGSSALVADPDAYVSEAEGHECTQLCPGVQMMYSVDSVLNVSALCRCKSGFGGQGVDCEACAANSYSSSHEGDEYNVVRECTQCPDGSTTGGQVRSTSIAACLCPPGTFLSKSEASCVWCPQWPFRSTAASGETQASACSCNASYTGLKEFSGTCGCDDGSYMNHRTRSCERCSNVERCTWATEIQRSLQPPVLKPGHWAVPVTELASFAKHSIWRCASQESCGEGGVCAEGREGLACGLCQAGHHGGPDGPCYACDERLSPTSRRWSLALGTLAVLVPTVVLLHISLVAKDDGVQMGLHLEATVGSIKQMVKHVQTVSIIGGLSVSWPPMAQAFFEALKRFTVNIPAFLQIGCLSDQTSVAMEMGFKWMMPLAFVSVTAVAMPFSQLVSRAIRCLKRHSPMACRRLPRPEKVAMVPADAARVILFTLTIFWTTLASNCMEMLTCVPSPNGQFTVDTYPQVLCSFQNSEFLAMGAVSLLAAVLYLLVPLKVLWMSYIRTTKHLAASERSERGWFHFLFQDFRDGHLLWLVAIMAKDASFVLVPVVLPGQGAGQLLLIAGLSAAHVCAVLQSTPFRDRSNSLLEAWNGATGAALCIYSVGMGYQKEVGVEDIEELFQDGKEDPLYRGRASGMVAVQVVAVGVPVLFLLYQLFCALERARTLLPKWLQPPSPEESKQWLDEFLAHDTEQAPFAGVLRKFDLVDLHHFRALLEQSSATMGHGLSRSSRSYLVRVHSELSRSSSRASREANGDELDPMDEEPEEGSRRRSHRGDRVSV